MKRRSREISIFSVSALDLFASALGAFILIAVVMFPYFPNTSRMPVVVAAPSPDCPPAAPPCPPVPVCPPCPPTPEPTPPATQFPHLDMVIALDVTGSMGQQIAKLKAEVGQLASVLSRLTPSLGLGLVAFGDRYWDRPITAFGLREIDASTVDQFRTFVRNLELNHGCSPGSCRNPDFPEAFLDALTAAAAMNWRSRAELRMIVLITDNPAYESEQEQAVSAAGSFAGAGDSGVSTVFIRTYRGDGSPHSAPGTEAFLRRVATAGRGRFVPDEGGSVTVNLLLALM